MSVSENEIVCYIVGNAITNAKVRGHAPVLKKVRGPDPLAPRFRRLCRGLLSRVAVTEALGRISVSVYSRKKFSCIYLNVAVLTKRNLLLDGL